MDLELQHTLENVIKVIFCLYELEKLSKCSLIKGQNISKRIFNQVTYSKNKSKVVHKNAPTVPTLMQALHEIFMVKEKITRSFFIG